MCLPKELGGGGGFGKTHFLPTYLYHAKQAWKLVHFEDCLMTRVLKGKYLGGGDLVKAPPGS